MAGVMKRECQTIWTRSHNRRRSVGARAHRHNSNHMARHGRNVDKQAQHGCRGQERTEANNEDNGCAGNRRKLGGAPPVPFVMTRRGHVSSLRSSTHTMIRMQPTATKTKTPTDAIITLIETIPSAHTHEPAPSASARLLFELLTSTGQRTQTNTLITSVHESTPAIHSGARSAIAIRAPYSAVPVATRVAAMPPNAVTATADAVITRAVATGQSTSTCGQLH